MRTIFSSLVAAALVLIPVSANAALITFEGYAPNGSAILVPPDYTESGFTLSYTSADSNVNDLAAVFGASSSGMIGNSTANLGWNTSGGSSIRLTGPASFDLVSLDLGGYVDAPGDKHTSITLVGYLTGGGTQTITFSNLLSLTTENVGWTGLDAVDFTGTYYGTVDNIFAGDESTAPEPATMLLAGAGIGVVALVRRRKSLRTR